MLSKVRVARADCFAGRTEGRDPRTLPRTRPVTLAPVLLDQSRTKALRLWFTNLLALVKLLA